MEITARSPKFDKNGNIELLATFPWLSEEVPFLASAADVEAHGVALYNRAMSGEFGVITNYTPVIVVPKSISKFQAKAILYQYGFLDTIIAIMADSSTPVLTRLAWEDAQDFERDSPTLAAMASLLNITSAQLDTMFIEGAQIKA